MSDWWNRLRCDLGTAADTMQVLNFLGVPGIPAYVGLVLLLGWLTGISSFWILVGAPTATFACLGSIFLGVMLVRPKRADLSEWTGHPVYSVWAAACLWAGQKPWPHIPADSPSYPMLQKLKGAIQAGEVHILSGTGNMEFRVSRDELVRYALTIGEHPLFLFPSMKG